MTHRRAGGRPATGSIVWADPETKTKPLGVRVTKANGKRRLVPFNPGTTADDARALAPLLSGQARFALDDQDGETVAKYSERWIAERQRRGLASVAEDQRRMTNHALPVLGPLPIRGVMRVDLVGFVERLDRRVRAGNYGWKTAQHIWSNVRTMFRDECGPLRIMQRAGHTTFDTTLIYIREAENFRADFGAPFPPLPIALLGAPKRARRVSASVSAFGVATLAARLKTRPIGGSAQESNLPETTFAASHRF
jgi:hypothetical protein